MNIPEELLYGTIQIGTDNGKTVYWPKNHSNKILCGMHRTGKTHYIRQFIIDSIKSHSSTFIIDTNNSFNVQNIHEELRNKIVVIDTSTNIGIDWHEITNVIPETELMKLHIDTVISNSLELVLQPTSTKMRRYISSASKVVFSTPDHTLGNIIDCLTDKEKREEYILKTTLQGNKVDSNINTLRELDNENNQQFVREQLTNITEDKLVKSLIDKSNNIDFKDLANDGYTVIIKLPIDAEPETINTIMALIYSKIWLTMIVLSKQTNNQTTHLVIEEINRFYKIKEIIKNHCKDSKKFGLSFVLTSTLLSTIHDIIPYAKQSKSSFMLFNSYDEYEFSPLKDILEKTEVSKEKIDELQYYHTLNIVSNKNKYSSFITRLPQDKSA